MLGVLLKSVLGAVFEAATNAWNDWRRDKALERKGALEAKEEAHNAQDRASDIVRMLRHRIATDPEFAKRMRDRFSGGPAKSDELL